MRFPRVPAYTSPVSPISPDDRAYDPISAARRQRWSTQAQGLGASSAAGIAASVASSMVKGVTVETQITPRVDWQPTKGKTSSEEGVVGWVVKNIVKPKVTVHTAGGPVTVAPYGSPTTNYFPIIVGAITLAALAGGWLMLRGLPKPKRRS